MDKLFKEKNDCCGCEACVQACSKGIIQMKRDTEGFYYPFVSDSSKCIQCHACERVCPVKHFLEINAHFTKAYAGWANDETDVIKSSSGGFATILAEKHILKGGIVYGVGYSNDYMGAEYYRAESIEDLKKLRGSKYIQAKKHDIYKRILQDIREKEVLFFGTPCDCYALSRIIHDRTKLRIVSLICHGPTTELVQQSFCSLLESKKESKIVDFNIRYKLNGNWKPYYIYAEYQEGDYSLEQFNRSDYNTAFLYFKRPSCSVCRFKKKHFAGDLLIGDYHSVRAGDSHYNAHGVSIMLPLNARGMDLIESVRDVFVYREVPLRTAISQQAIHSPVKKNIDREAFSRLLSEKGLQDACNHVSVKINKKATAFNALKAKARRFVWEYFKV